MQGIELKDATKKYENGKIVCLNKINCHFEYGKMYVILGPSGTGKTTLLNIIGLNDCLDKGQIILDGQDITKKSNIEKSLIKNEQIGMVFQNYLLIDDLKVIENVMLPAFINKNFKRAEIKEKALNLLQELGIADKANKFPKKLSGGEKQRVAIARALINDPQIILADEPTGNLDDLNERKIFEMLKKISKNHKCVIVVSHNQEIVKYADVVIKLAKGEFTYVNKRKNSSNK